MQDLIEYVYDQLKNVNADDEILGWLADELVDFITYGDADDDEKMRVIDEKIAEFM